MGNTLATAFDEVIRLIQMKGYHDHRSDDHSNALGDAIFADLVKRCPSLGQDVKAGKIRHWLNVPAPGARNRKADLVIGERAVGKDAPDLTKARVFVENKSVITAHRNKTNRYDDLNETLEVLHRVRPDAIIIATVIVGTAERVLNIPDGVKKRFKGGREADFETKIRPRLSKGDQSLWTEFLMEVSPNRPKDPEQTIALMRTLPTRHWAHTHQPGYDYVLLAPALIDNVNPPRLDSSPRFNIEVQREYDNMIDLVGKAYTARWHS